MIITISGTPGAGDTTTAEMLGEETGFKVIEVGEIQKKIAKEKGITSEQLWEQQKKNPGKMREFHEKLDQEQREAAEKEDNLIVNGKLSAFQIPKADLKIFLYADLRERARRILMREKIGRKEFAEQIDEGKETENEPTDLEIQKKIKEIEEREENETENWENLYRFNYIEDTYVYDLIIDTTHKKPSEVVEKIKKKLETVKDEEQS